MNNNGHYLLKADHVSGVMLIALLELSHLIYVYPVGPMLR